MGFHLAAHLRLGRSGFRVLLLERWVNVVKVRGNGWGLDANKWTWCRWKAVSTLHWGWVASLAIMSGMLLSTWRLLTGKAWLVIFRLKTLRLCCQGLKSNSCRVWEISNTGAFEPASKEKSGRLGKGTFRVFELLRSVFEGATLVCWMWQRYSEICDWEISPWFPDVRIQENPGAIGAVIVTSTSTKKLQLLWHLY